MNQPQTLRLNNMQFPRRIVLVEDEADVADMLQIFFETQGYTLIHAADGQTGIEACQKHMPHVILMDIALPDINGFEVCERLNSTTSTAHIPIIFLTRRDTRDNRLQALELGAVDFVPKPFDPEELLLRVRNQMSYAEQSSLVDQTSGLPGAFVAREYVRAARTDPDLAIIEASLKHATPYYQVYGDAALRKVQADLGRIVVWSFDQARTDQGFAGYLDEDHLVVVCPAPSAAKIAERIVSIFNFNVRRDYEPQDLERGYLVAGGEHHPLMHVVCQIYGEDSYAEIA